MNVSVSIQPIREQQTGLPRLAALQTLAYLDQQFQVWVIALGSNPLGLFITTTSDQIHSLHIIYTSHTCQKT